MTTSGTLEQAVTLADVVSVVRARRVALPPEVAGYLALEVASEGLTRLAGANGTNTAIPDPTRIFLSHEGTVGIVSTPSAFREGDLEAFVRGFLGTLFDAAGSSTPALAAVATSTSLRSLESLRHELSSALIPVNRAAGRRALARVSREVRRVISGVGRNQNVESFTPPQGPVSHLPDEDDVHTTRKTIPPGLLVQAYPSSSMPSAEDHGSGD